MNHFCVVSRIHRQVINELCVTPEYVTDAGRYEDEYAGFADESNLSFSDFCRSML